MEFLEDKDYKRAIKEKNAVLVCASSKDYPFSSDSRKDELVIGKCKKCKAGIVFTTDSEKATTKLCPNCALIILKRIDNSGKKLIVNAHERSREMGEALEEEFVKQDFERKTGVAS